MVMMILKHLINVVYIALYYLSKKRMRKNLTPNTHKENFVFPFNICYLIAVSENKFCGWLRRKEKVRI